MQGAVIVSNLLIQVDGGADPLSVTGQLRLQALSAVDEADIPGRGTEVSAAATAAASRNAEVLAGPDLVRVGNVVVSRNLLPAGAEAVANVAKSVSLLDGVVLLTTAATAAGSPAEATLVVLQVAVQADAALLPSAVAALAGRTEVVVTVSIDADVAGRAGEAAGEVTATGAVTRATALVVVVVLLGAVMVLSPASLLLLVSTLLLFLSALLLLLLVVTLVLPVRHTILELVAGKGTSYGTDEGAGLAVAEVAANLVTTESTGSTSGKGTGETTLTVLALLAAWAAVASRSVVAVVLVVASLVLVRRRGREVVLLVVGALAISEPLLLMLLALLLIVVRVGLTAGALVVTSVAALRAAGTAVASALVAVTAALVVVAVVAHDVLLVRNEKTVFVYWYQSPKI